MKTKSSFFFGFYISRYLSGAFFLVFLPLFLKDFIKRVFFRSLFLPVFGFSLNISARSFYSDLRGVISDTQLMDFFQCCSLRIMGAWVTFVFFFSFFLICFLFKHWYLYATPLILVAVFIVGSFLLGIEIPTKQKISVAIIQPGSHKTHEEQEAASLLLLEMALEGGSVLAVVPESAFPGVVFNEDISDEETNSYALTMPRNGESAYKKLIALSKKNPYLSIAIGLESKKGGESYNSIIVFED